MQKPAYETLGVSAMYCEKCGNLLDDDEMFCKKCGTKRMDEDTYNQTVHSNPTVVTEVDGVASGSSGGPVITVTNTRYTTTELCKLIQQQYRMFISQQKYYDRLCEIEKVQSAGKPKKGIISMYLAYALVACGVYLVISGASSLMNGTGIPGDFVFGIIVVAGCAYYFYMRHQKVQNLGDLDEEKDRIAAVLYDYYCAMPSKLFCFEYSNPYTLSMMFDIAQSQRLHTVKDVVNAYEEERVRQTIASIDEQTRSIEAYTRGVLSTYIALQMARPVVVYA